ncbi:MAG: PhzF family phenazine biosynthesis protein, partial [Desulfocapsa sp.]|nr:PhzF family phenazine biosynthesis protein [Desulfocapsa sp.]
MKKFSFKKIDAFTDGSSGGNPAGIIFLESFNDISENEMQQIALE